MDSIHWPFLFAQIVTFFVMGGWIVLAGYALLKFNDADFETNLAALAWAVFIVVVPLLGAIAFLGYLASSRRRATER